MNSRTRVVLGAGLVVLAGAVACGGGDGDSGPPDSGRRTVIVANNEFQPATVTIERGDTILWSWANSGLEHNIIPFLDPTFDKKGNNVVLGGGTVGTDYFNAPASHQVVFSSAGRYWYFCSTHGNTDTTSAGMKGKVVVN